MKDIQGILFDMDGVLVDSEYPFRLCCIKKLREYGIEATHEDFMPFSGMGEDAFIGGVVKKFGREYETYMKDECYEEYGKSGRELIKVSPGIKDAVLSLKGKYAMAVASAADRVKVLVNLSVTGLSEADFDAVVTGCDVVKKKPHPDIYIAAAKKIGVAPENCIVVEDTASGVKAGKAAGATVIGVAGTFTREQLMEAGASFFVNETREILNILG